MSLLRNIATGLRSLFQRAQVDRELDEELGAYVEMAVEEKMKDGMSRKDALRAVRLERGSLEGTKEIVRSGGWESFVETCWRDVRFAARMLRKSPGFTLVAVLTLALGVGVNTSVFSAFDSVALKPLPVKDPHDVVRPQRWFASGAMGDIQYAFSYPEYLYYRNQNRAFSGLIAASWPRQVLATEPSTSETKSTAPHELLPLQCQLVSENYFSVLGIRMEFGQAFAGAEERAPGSNPVTVLSYRYWRGQLNGDREVVGKTLEVDRTSLTIIGVAPEDFIGTGNPPEVPDFWVPLEMQTQLEPQNDWLHEPSNQPLQIVGRLAPETSIDQAQAETEVLIRRFEQDHVERDQTIGLTLHRATYFGVTDELWFRGFVAGLMAVVGLVCSWLASIWQTCRLREVPAARRKSPRAWRSGRVAAE